MSDIPRVTVSQLAFPSRKWRSRRGHDVVFMAMVLAPEREDEANYYGSPDGNPETVTNLPKSECTVVHGINERFVVMKLPGFIVVTRGFRQAPRPGLSSAVRWTISERSSWGCVVAVMRVKRGAHIAEANLRSRPKNTYRAPNRYVSSGW